MILEEAICIPHTYCTPSIGRSLKEGHQEVAMLFVIVLVDVG